MFTLGGRGMGVLSSFCFRDVHSFSGIVFASFPKVGYQRKTDNFLKPVIKGVISLLFNEIGMFWGIIFADFSTGYQFDGKKIRGG